MRKKIDNYYRLKLENIPGITNNTYSNIERNYSYFPLFVSNEYSITRDELYYKLKKGINGRVILSPNYRFPMYKNLENTKDQNLNVAKSSGPSYLLTIYDQMKTKEVDKIAEIISIA